MMQRNVNSGCRDISVNISRSGWRKLGNMNRELGANYIRAYEVRMELCAYLKMYEDAGMSLDTQWQELRYDEKICLIIRKVQGIWYVIDIWITDMAMCTVPLYMWKVMRKSGREIMTRILIGWQAIRAAVGLRGADVSCGC